MLQAFSKSLFSNLLLTISLFFEVYLIFIRVYLILIFVTLLHLLHVEQILLKNQTLGSNYRDNLGHQIENIVFIELLRRGYNVDVGDYSGKKIDFVASKGNEIKYYQVTEHLPEGITRETDNLRYIPDGYQKTVLSLSQFDEGTVDGIAVKYLIDWLLEE